MSNLQVFDGDLAVDDRGSLSFVNSMSFSDVRRMYMVENFSTETIRAFHGHKEEAKYVYVVSGSILLIAAKMTGSLIHEPTKYVLSARRPKILYIPAGYANGFRALEGNTKIMFFSTSTLEESKKDDFRFPADALGDDIWKVENR